MITLSVGPNKAYQSIQSAINALTAMVSANNGSLSQSAEIIVYEGIHGGFIIPPSGLGTSSAATVTIKAAPNNRVVLSGWNTSPANGHGYRTVGIGVGENNPYVKIRGIRVENFMKGIVFSANCDYYEVQSTYVRLCSNAGVWAYRSDYGQIVNSSILDCDYNLVLTDVDDVFVAHNDLVKLTDPPSSGSGEKCVIHITTNAPSSVVTPGNRPSPPGALVFYNNNIVASGGGKLICYGLNVLQKLRSNNNNLYNAGGAVASSLVQGASIANISSLAGWQAMSNGDFDSISEYPPYLITQQAGNSLYTTVDLLNFPSFGGVKKGFRDLCNAATASTASGNIPYGTVPQYVDTSLLCETLQSNFSATAITRPNPPSIGAYDTLNDPNGFGSSVVPVGVPGSGTDSSACQGGAAVGIATVEEKYAQSVECITPSVVPGFFYIHDIEHYLYSNKVGMYLADVTVTDIVLGARPHDQIHVYVDDKEIPDKSWRIENNILRIYHKDLDITDFDAQIKIEAYVLKWKGNDFIKEKFHQITKIRHGDTRYILPYEPTRGAPIVITDDKVNYADDATMLGWEFSTEWNDKEEKVELKFGHKRNLIENPQFDYSYIGYTGSISEYASNKLVPDNWGLYTGDALVLSEHVTTVTSTTGMIAGSGSYTGSVFDTGATGAYNLYPKIGHNFCLLSGDIRQRVRIDFNSPYWVSMYAAGVKKTGEMNTTITGSFTLGITYYDVEMRELTGNAVSTGFSVVSNFKNPTGHWTRCSVPLRYATYDGLLNMPQYNSLDIPENAFFMDVKLSSSSPVALDAISVTQSQTLQDYHRRIRGYEATIEYDTGLSDLYDVHDLTLTPIRNRNANGFMYIGAVPARQFDTGAPVDTTTLTDWGWANGRINHLPWARVSGKNKLRNRGQFNLTNQGQREDVTIQPTISYPEEIQLIPTVPTSNLQDGKGQYEQFFSSGNIGVAGTDFTIKVTDGYGNPYAFEWVDVYLTDNLYDQGSQAYVGLIGSRDLGFYREFGNPIAVQLDSAGAAVVRWVPPSAGEAMYEFYDTADLFQQDDDGDWFIDNVPYRINEAGHGNAFITTPRRPDGYPIRETGFSNSILGVHSQAVNGSNSIRMYKMGNTPMRDNFELWVNHTGAFSATGALASVYDLKLVQSEVPEINEGEYFLDDVNRMLFVRWNGLTNDQGRSVRTRFNRRNLYIKSSEDGVVDDHRMYLTNSMMIDLRNDLSVANPAALTYDIRMDMQVRAKSPVGMTVEYAWMTANNTTGAVLRNIRERVMNTAIVGKSLQKRVGLHG